MGIRLTGISTPFGGAEWEYTDKQKDYAAPIVISPDQRIKVFHKFHLWRWRKI